jgi:hypothetical protein
MTVPWRWLDGDSRVIELSGGNQQKIDVTGQILEVDGGVANQPRLPCSHPDASPVDGGESNKNI